MPLPPFSKQVKRIVLMLVLCTVVFSACRSHEHIPDQADCQHEQRCAECGELLADWGEHDYAEQPDEASEGYLFYACRVCGEIKIVNEDGLPVVPIE